MDEKCRKEITELHRFFQDWLTGRLPATDEAFARFAGVLDHEFEIITPTARILGREELLRSFRGAHSTHCERPRFRIRIEDVQGRPLQGNVYLATYQEWQGNDDDARGRLSTALFEAQAGTPHGVSWLHVHEVWIP